MSLLFDVVCYVWDLDSSKLVKLMFHFPNVVSFLRSFFIFPSDGGISLKATFTKYEDKYPRISDVQACTQVELTQDEFEFRHDINRMELWKVPLFEWLPCDFGFLYHAYLVFQTEDQGETSYWSIEKTSDQKIHIQESAYPNDVIQFVAGKRRLQNRFWRPRQIAYFANDFKIKNMIEIKRMFYEVPQYLRLRCLDTKYFAKDAFNLLWTGKISCDYVFSTSSYILDTVKNVIVFPPKYYIELSAYIVLYLYKSLYVAAFWGIFHMLSSIRGFSFYRSTEEPKESHEKSRFI